jgi:exodeoxyribonuclease VII small subunit
MADESHTFGSTRARLDEIVAQVRKKDTSLEKSLDLLEEGVRLANACTELIDHQDWGIVPPQPSATSGSATVAESGSAGPQGDGRPTDASGDSHTAPATDASGDSHTAPATDASGDSEVVSPTDALTDGAPDESFDAALSAWSDDAPETGEDYAGSEDPESDDSEAAQ